MKLPNDTSNLMSLATAMTDHTERDPKNGAADGQFHPLVVLKWVKVQSFHKSQIVTVPSFLSNVVAPTTHFSYLMHGVP